MAFANPAITDLIATTIENRSSSIADNVTNSNAILKFLKNDKNSTTFDGGQFIQENLSFAENSNVTSISGYDTFGIGASDVLSAAKYDVKSYVCAISSTGLEVLLNSGKSALIDMVTSRIDVAESTLQNKIVQGIYSDGTGNSGKDITGLQAAVPITNTAGTYGGINRATWTKWQNKKYKGSVDGAGNATSATIQGSMNNLWLQLCRGTDKPNVGVMDSAYYALFLASLQPLQRFTDEKTAALGFQNTMFQSAPIIFENTGTGMPASTLYFLNTKYLKFRSHKDRNFTLIGDARTSVNQDASIQVLGWAGNLTSSGIQFQGVMQN